ncbi:MAG: cold-shock protein [Mesorhizobium sp.]|nr:MAG: cold-shock protein [Mesorhizobium sp.]TIX52345.1 MAG: cold-shock protein [Mesorhizobium sp.]TIX79312.1 MAG: cold-shock protein [Mesorhizobium sp.]
MKSQGTVKWYNPEKGFGFIAPDNSEKDVFVHANALNRSGLSVLVEGQKVFVECGQGKKGLEVRSIRLA